MSDAPWRFIRIEGGANSGELPVWDGRDLERNPAWNLLGLPSERLEDSGGTNDGLETGTDSRVLTYGDTAGRGGIVASGESSTSCVLGLGSNFFGVLS